MFFLLVDRTTVTSDQERTSSHAQKMEPEPNDLRAELARADSFTCLRPPSRYKPQVGAIVQSICFCVFFNPYFLNYEQMWTDQLPPEEMEQPGVVLPPFFVFFLNWILFQIDTLPGTFSGLNLKNYWTV